MSPADSRLTAPYLASQVPMQNVILHQSNVDSLATVLKGNIRSSPFLDVIYFRIDVNIDSIAEQFFKRSHHRNVKTFSIS